MLNEDKSHSDYQIKAYTPGAITVNDTTYHQSLIIAPTTLIDDWPPQCLAELKHQHLDTILALAPEIVILGSGRAFQLPSKGQLAPLYQQLLGVECMDTGAACRTYMALNSENRRVVAALLIA